MALLEVSSLTRYFGGLAAVDAVSMEVNRGEVVGLVGPNGAGKTTLFNLVTGFLRPTRGKVLFKEEDVTGLKPNRIAGKGMVRTFQSASTLFQMRTVWENVLIACHLQFKAGLLWVLLNAPRTRKEEREVARMAAELIESMGLSSVKNEYARNLPYGHQRMLGVCLALAANPELVLLDEPVTGLTPEEASIFMGRLRELRDRGIAILLVEHNMRAVMGSCDRIVVLNHGKKIAEGSPGEIRGNREVIEAYLGVDANVA
jgi:branched-chain amino acid transport system ATP-binding protein